MVFAMASWVSRQKQLKDVQDIGTRNANKTHAAAYATGLICNYILWELEHYEHCREHRWRQYRQAAWKNVALTAPSFRGICRGIRIAFYRRLHALLTRLRRPTPVKVLCKSGYSESASVWN